MTAYEQRCRETCPEGCGKNKHREMHTFFDKDPNGETVYGHPGPDPWKSWDWFRCTAPTIEQFAEEMAQTVRDMGQDVLDARAERDQWREKFEQRDRECKALLGDPDAIHQGAAHAIEAVRQMESKDAAIQLRSWLNDAREALALAEQQLAAKDQEIRVMDENYDLLETSVLEIATIAGLQDPKGYDPVVYVEAVKKWRDIKDQEIARLKDELEQANQQIRTQSVRMKIEMDRVVYFKQELERLHKPRKMVRSPLEAEIEQLREALQEIAEESPGGMVEIVHWSQGVARAALAATSSEPKPCENCERLREALQWAYPFVTDGKLVSITRGNVGKPRELVARETRDAALAASDQPSAKDVHTEHCCVTHGCKYGDDDCSVTTGVKKQSTLCEYCEQSAQPNLTPTPGERAAHPEIWGPKKGP